MLKILIDSNIPFLPDCLNDVGETEIFSGGELTNSILKEYDCEMLFCRSTVKVNEELLKDTNVKFVATATSGTDHFDIEYLESKGISWHSAAGSNANSVAEYVVYSILRWMFFDKRKLNDCKIGIIGYGHVGKLVAKYSELLGLEVWLNDPPLREVNYEFPKQYKYSSLEDIFRNCDIVTNHVPLNGKGNHPTKNLLNAELISLLKAGDLFVHASRGGVVDETALLDAINVEEIYASLDTWIGEPLVNKKLADVSMFSTPHTAGHSFDAKLRGTKMMFDAFKKYTNSVVKCNILNDKLSKYKSIDKSYFNKPNDLVKLIFESRQIDQDSLLLLKSLNFDKEKAASFFKSMRKNYPIRREVL